jgi:7,8-dihydropterin-6-yl-methyl-4-(beta-D-ribofuranosyl)aminobenzene 5'-phosphate synthase
MASTGELAGIEQALVLGKGREVSVIAGCSHPGLGEIIEKASTFGRVRAIVGGLHGFSDFELLRDIDMVCPTHCTSYREEIRALYPEKFMEGGVGAVLTL